MATYVFTDAFLSVAGTDLSDHVRSVEFTLEKAAVDDTNMGDTTTINLGGLRNWSMNVTFSQDFAASKVDATLWGIWDAAAGTGALILRGDNSDGVSATNPNYTGTGLLTSYPPIGGAVGDHAETSVTFVPAGAAARATS